MKKIIVIVLIVTVVFVLGFTTITPFNNEPEQVKAAINKSLPLLQSSSHTFLVNAGGCHSCHGQSLGVIAFELAKEKGFSIADTILNEAIDSMHINWTAQLSHLAELEDPTSIAIKGGYDLWAFAAANKKPTRTIELLTRNIMYRQCKDGNWVSPNDRPPLEYYSFTATATAIKAIQTWMPAIFKNEVQQRVTKAREWLMKTTPFANEEKAFQLLGLYWSNAGGEFMKQQAQKLMASQHKDGGWSQLESLPSDAYATGQSLYALYQSGQLSIKDPVYQKGLDFLIKTQHADGSWNIQTRSFPTVTYVDSGFPHGKNQFISAAGSNWATMALLLASTTP